MNVIGPGSSTVKVKKKKKKHYHEIKASARMLLMKAIESKEGGLEELLWGISLEQDYKKLEKLYNDRRLKYEAMIKQKEDELSLFLEEEDITSLWTELMISRVLKNNKFTFTPYRHSNIYTDSNQYIDEIRPESSDNIRKSISISINSPTPTSNSSDFNNTINIKDFKQYMVDRDKKRRVSSIIKQVKREEKRDSIKQKEENNNDVNKSVCINNNKADSLNNKDDNQIDDDKSDADSIISDITFRKKDKDKTSTETSNRNLAEVDIVADLFSMSNELRLEREQISFNSNQDVALNRLTTLKYAAVLEDVVQTKEETERARRRAALLRMQKNAMKYNNLGKSDTSVFFDFWVNVQKLQSSSIENNEAENIAMAQRKAVSDKINSNLAKSVLEAQINTLFKAKLLLNEKFLASGKPANEKSGFKFDLELTSYQKIYGVVMPEKEQAKGKSTRQSFSGLSVHITNKNSPKKIISHSTNYDNLTSRHLNVDEEELAMARKRRRELAKLIRLAAGTKREKKAVERVLAELPEEMKEEFEARVEAKRMLMKEAMMANAMKNKRNEYDDSDDERNKETIRRGAFLTQKLLDMEYDSDEDIGNESNMTPRIKGRYTAYGDESGLLYSGSLLPMSSPSSLTGRWGYDPSIDEGPVEPLYISGGVNRDLPNFNPNFPRRLEVFPMHSRGLDVDEVSFDPDSFFVFVTRVREGFTLRDMSIHINDVYVTQSRFPDMVTLRASPRSGYDGYLGTIQHSAWSEVVKTMEDAIDDAISKTIDARNRYNTVKECHVDNSTVDNNIGINPSPRPARLVLDDFFITSSEATNNVAANKVVLDDSILLQNTFPTANHRNIKDQSSDGINNTIASLPNIYASIAFAAPKAIEKTVESKANRLYNNNLKNTVFNNILSTSSLYAESSNDHNNSNINTLSNTEMMNNNKPRRPDIIHSPQKSPKIRNVSQKSLIADNNNNNINDEKEVEIDKNVASGYAALGEQIEFVIGGNQPPTLTRFVTKDIRSPSQKSRSKRKSELIAEAMIEANKGNIKNTNVIHKVYDKTKTTRGINIAKELARKVKQQEVVEEDITKLVLLVESERLMHLYFAKKFLQLDLMIDPVLTIYDALETIKHKPRQYGLIFVNYQHLETSGDIKKSLMSILPVEVNENDYTIIVYGAVNPDDELLTLFEHCGVTDILEEPYTAEKIKNIYLAHENKVSMTKKIST